jgi:cobalt/nickel transport system permease protein
MHLGNGAITPECGAIALAAAAAGAGVAIASARACGLDRAQARTAGALAAAVFAAQLFNVQVLPYSSVHLIGGVLLAWTLGPAIGLLSMSGILALQAVLLGDGGLMAWGANVINMGLLPALGVMVLRRALIHRGSNETAIALGLTAFVCTLGGAALIALEVTVGRGSAQLEGWSQFAGQMLATHAMAGAVEGVATVALAVLLGALTQPAGHMLQLSHARAGAVAAASLVIAVLSLPAFGLASRLPDGYEAALAAVAGAGRALGHVEVLGSSGLGATVQSWQQSIVSLWSGPDALVVLTGTLLAGGLAWLVAGCLAGPRWQQAR